MSKLPIQKQEGGGIKRSKYKASTVKSAFTVVTTGDNPDGQCDVSAWKDIIWVCVGGISEQGFATLKILLRRR